MTAPLRDLLADRLRHQDARPRGHTTGLLQEHQS